ncbi:MAG: Na+/H+ antiporter subunit C [SAR116 cluster bacterium]|jgi:multicomponent Na+:H+ antiporter subunit C|nr:Na+/H+ antiporter subunit C [SAR116 cluster bacterium]|tara:strand:- start:8 stop:403 length:396 start_codon:yes stop_codon:yes gene_type:complete
MINEIFGVWNYWIVFTLMMIGLYIVISKKSLLKKVVGLAIFQTSVFLLYITFGKIAGGTAPIITNNSEEIYSNPLPHVLILTAIVVGVATTALGLALIVRINKAYGSINEDEISAVDLVDYHEKFSEKKNK